MNKIFSIAGILFCMNALAANQEAATIDSARKTGTPGAFDIAQTAVKAGGQHTLLFTQQLHEPAGAVKPAATGKLEGSMVAAYVWPTSIDSSAAGFSPKQGTLALAVTAHPDFDDTPQHDENGDGNKGNDGNEWHSHWVVLVPDDACGGKGTLKVKDISEADKAALPKNAPGLPILLSSPGYKPQFNGNSLQVSAQFPAQQFAFDGVTAALQVHRQGKNPLLCVVQVHDIASGDLSLPGKVN
jgi:hypothetical protein